MGERVRGSFLHEEGGSAYMQMNKRGGAAPWVHSWALLYVGIALVVPKELRIATQCTDTDGG